MNKKTWFVLPGVLLLAACQSVDTQQAGISKCVTPPPDTACAKGVSVVNLNLKAAGGPTVAPECIAVDAGSSFDIMITPADDPGIVVTEPQNAPDDWLRGRNGNAGAVNRIRITVPAAAEQGKIHKYLVLSDRFGCLDPRVQVDRQG